MTTLAPMIAAAPAAAIACPILARRSATHASHRPVTPGGKGRPHRLQLSVSSLIFRPQFVNFVCLELQRN